MGARLGQHFLFDPGILGRIADAAGLTARDTVLEIGPGKGTLTAELLKRSSHVTCIELDRRLAEDLAGRVGAGLVPARPDVAGRPQGSPLQVIQGDALKVPWPPADVICGNVPYQITSPLIERALVTPRPKRIVFLIQKEVADRVAAPPGSEAYGARSAGVQLVADVERLFTVKAGAFRPPPKVESAVVRITPRAIPIAASAAEESRARAIIHAVFQRRRQQIQRSLREFLGQDQSAVSGRLSAVGLDPAERPENLSPQDFVTLARSWPSA